MSSWTRGPVCGIGNCPTRLYKIIDGQHVCKYGHVKEDLGLQIDDEEEISNNPDGTMGVRTNVRQLRIPKLGDIRERKSQIHNSKSKRKFGNELHILYGEVFQFLFRRQMEFLISYFNLPKETTVTTFKTAWLRYLSKYIFVDSVFKNTPNLIDLTTMCYILCAKLKYPIYLYDLIQLIAKDKFPYLYSSRYLPEELKLSAASMSILNPPKAPQNNEIYSNYSKICKILEIEEIGFNYKPLLLKLVVGYSLPVRFFCFMDEIVDRFEINFRIASNQDAYEFPELKVISVFILTIKSYLLRTLELVEERVEQEGDEEENEDLGRGNTSENAEFKYFQVTKWLECIDQVDNSNIPIRLYDLERTSDPVRKLMNWSNQDVSTYLTWLDQHYLGPMPQETIAQKRLADIFNFESNPDLDEMPDFFPQKSTDLFGSKSSVITYDELSLIQEKLFNQFTITFGFKKTTMSIAMSKVLKHIDFKQEA